jgi:hypothetical protein
MGAANCQRDLEWLLGEEYSLPLPEFARRVGRRAITGVGSSSLRSLPPVSARSVNRNATPTRVLVRRGASNALNRKCEANFNYPKTQDFSRLAWKLRKQGILEASAECKGP